MVLPLYILYLMPRLVLLIVLIKSSFCIFSVCFHLFNVLKVHKVSFKDLYLSTPLIGDAEVDLLYFCEGRICILADNYIQSVLQ